MKKRDFWLDTLQVHICIDDLHQRLTMHFEDDLLMYKVVELLEEMERNGGVHEKR